MACEFDHGGPAVAPPGLSVRKRQEGTTHPDRNGQFEHINATAEQFLTAGQPVISVDTKKKELVGIFVNKGRELQPKGTSPAVLVRDFPSDAKGQGDSVRCLRHGSQRSVGERGARS